MPGVGMLVQGRLACSPAACACCAALPCAVLCCIRRCTTTQLSLMRRVGTLDRCRALCFQSST